MKLERESPFKSKIPLQIQDSMEPSMSDEIVNLATRKIVIEKLKHMSLYR